MFASKDIFLKSSGGYQISRSVRIRQSASAYLNRTPASAGNRKTWTWSGWVKIGKAASTGLFTASTSGSNMYTIQLGVNGELSVYAYTGTYPYFRNTSAVFRDYSAWYHFVVAFDSTQATDTNRIKIYVNGVLQSTTSGSGSGWPTLNYDGGVNNTINHQFSDNVGGASYFDGYLTEINFVDGQALTPSSFGETNALTGVWQPKRYAGTYGTNGFYLNFSDNSGVTATTIGKDYSGNGNNWTPNNISVTAGTTYDSMLDSPTPYADGGNGRGNYCTLNPLDGNNATLSGANLDFVTLSTGSANTLGSIYVPTGKWYWEQVATSNGNIAYYGIRNGPSGYYVAYYGSNGNRDVNGSTSSYGATFGNNDIIGVALDMDAGTITFYKNNVSQGAITIGNSGPFAPWIADGASGTSVTGSINFGQRPFTYTPPTGFVALNTQNLPTPTISNGATVMAATLYTGTNANLTVTNTVSGVSMQPDLVWMKARSSAFSNTLTDSVRGVSKQIFSNLTNAETTESGKGLTAFNSNGFTLGPDLVTTGSTNANGTTYVAWQWNAGGSTVTNTNGSISAQVRANTTAGFSIVTYTGTGSAATIGHGLGVAPQMIIVFERSPGGDDHIVYHVSLTSNSYSIRLNTTAAQAGPSGAYWNSTSPTSSVFSVGTSGESNQSTATYVAYCFAAVAGYSAFGSYTGNGSTDGPFVFCGFRPRFVMIRNPAIVANWLMFDSSRDTYNPEVLFIFANTSDAEQNSSASVALDFVSNGFKIRQTSGNINASGNALIYMAFAENPFKLSLAR